MATRDDSADMGIMACVTLAVAGLNFVFFKFSLPTLQEVAWHNGLVGAFGTFLLFVDLITFGYWGDRWRESPIGIRFAAWRNRLPEFRASLESAPSEKIKFSKKSAPRKALLIGEGSFQVDRQRAIDVLSKFQLAKAEESVLAFVRGAVLAGARNIRFEAVPSGFELRFDGEPLSKRQLQDPYAPLFDDAPDSGESGRFLALGLLAAQRLGPRRIAFSSGRGAERLTLWLESGKDSSRDNPPGEETAVRITWSLRLRGGVMRRRCLGLVRERCALVAADLRINGMPVPKSPRADRPALAFAEGGLRGVIGIHDAGARMMASQFREVSRTRLYRQGVLIKTAGIPLPLVQGEIDINDDSFSLSASHDSVVEDDRYKAALKFLDSLPPRLIIEAARIHAERYPALDPDKDLTETLLRHISRNHRFWRWEDSVTTWLREAADSLLSDYPKDSKEPHLKALWETPLFLRAAGSGISLLTLTRIQKRTQRILATYVARRGDTPLPDVVWCPTRKAKDFLNRRFKVEFIY